MGNKGKLLFIVLVLIACFISFLIGYQIHTDVANASDNQTLIWLRSDNIVEIGDRTLPNKWGFEAPGIRLNGHLGVMTDPDEMNGAAGIWYKEKINLGNDIHYRGGISGDIAVYKTTAPFSDVVGALGGVVTIPKENTQNWDNALYSGGGVDVINSAFYTEPGATGTLNWGNNIFTESHFYGDMPVNKWVGLFMQNPHGKPGALDNSYAIYIEPQTFGRTNWAVYVADSINSYAGTSYFGTGVKLGSNKPGISANSNDGVSRSLLWLDGNNKLRFGIGALWNGLIQLNAGQHFIPANNGEAYLGGPNNKWGYIWGKDIRAGDLNFENDWRFTETEGGIALVRPDGSVAQEWTSEQKMPKDKKLSVKTKITSIPSISDNISKKEK